MIEEWKYAVVNLADNSTTVSSKPALLHAIYVNTAFSAHQVSVEDAATAVFLLPAGSPIGDKFCFNTRFETSLIIDPDDAATGNITVMYRDLRA